MVKKYKPASGDIDSATAIKQAAQALDLVGTMAEEVKDTDTLLAVSKLWMELIDPASQHSSEREATVHQIGFAPNKEEGNNERVEGKPDSRSK